MLKERYKKYYDNWRSIEDFSGASDRSMTFFDYASEIIPVIDRTFEECGYTKHGIDYTLFVCGEGYGMTLGLNSHTPNRKNEESRRRKVVAEFLRELASKIEAGEC